MNSETWKLSCGLAALGASLAIFPVNASSLLENSPAPVENRCPTGEDALRPDLLYGERLQFKVQRNGDTIGTQTTNFRINGNIVEASTETRLRVRFLFVTAYSLTFESQSTWCTGALQSFSAHMNDNGKTRDVSATYKGGFYDVSGRGGELTVEAPLTVNEYWNQDTLKGGQILNGLNGRIANISVYDMGDDTVEVEGGTVSARHYRMRGDLDTDVWYDKDGRWVRMSFVTKKDKSRIDYYCMTCKPDQME